MHRTISIAVIIAGLSHVFCCFLPALFSIISLFTSMGAISVLPSFINSWHNFMHAWESLIITISAIFLALGWILYFISKKINCHNTGCKHGACEPKKEHSGKIMLFATLLFLVNLSGYLFLHI